MGKQIKNQANGLNSVNTVIKKNVCCGCGACLVICPTSCIEFVYGNRYNFPRIDAKRCAHCGKCLEVCPSAFLLKGTYPGFSDEPAKASYGCYLIHSKDDEIRLDSSSGGFITGMIIYLMDKRFADGGIVARCEGDHPLVAESFVATDRKSLLSAMASKYAPVSSCTVLADVLKYPGRYVFVGTPCMIEALTKLQESLSKLQERIILKIGLVCAGMASRLSTKIYIEENGRVNLKDIHRICYRGNGWPGRFRVFGEGGKVLMDRPYLGGSLIHVVSRDHYLRCENCLDHWGRFADIVVSDPWTNEMVRTECKGRSAVMVRTERGKEALASAIDNGDMAADSIAVEEMLSYNKHLVIDSKHARHGWMAWYQLLFFGRVRYLGQVIGNLLRRRRVGLKTTLKARLSRQYYY
jgi:coenzyme F420 hydrogenase subunit beta